MSAMSDDALALRTLHASLLDAWNRRDANGIASLFSDNGSQVGFDGSIANGPDEILSHLEPIFRDHPTARFVARVREVRTVGQNAALLRAVAGMVPPGQTKIKPELNTIQTLVASRARGLWRIEMFHNTPAAWHGRPQDVEKLTAELQAVADGR